jgi:Asp-tRNA(Asn)/Glu-tRNA(Gln) amidotransferase A subunit family amidase
MKPTMRPFLAGQAAFRSGSDSPRAFLERCIDRIQEREPRIGAFVTLNIDGARAAADRSSARWRTGRPRSAIDGMPIGIKDIIETADMPTEQGSPLFAGWRGNRDAASVAALREAGAVILGKTVTTEFAATEPRGTRNPHDPERTPGGSSSGSAAAVADGMISAALGTQVIGSILRPASYCGCYGFKPTVGGLNRGGSFDHLSQSCAGTLAASLAEAWLVARTISMRAGGDPGFAGLSGPLQAPEPKRPCALAVLRTAGHRVAASEAREALGRAVAKLGSKGLAILDRDNNSVVAAVEEAIADATSLSRRINAWEARWPLNTYARDMDRSKLSRAMHQRLAEAEAMTQEDYRVLLAERNRIRSAYIELANFCDACITLAAPGPAPVGLSSTGDPVFAVPSSLLGVPALSLPLLECERLPLGLQLIGFRDADPSLFGVAAYLEGPGALDTVRTQLAETA